MTADLEFRRTSQALLPARRPAPALGYDPYPLHDLGAGAIEAGWDALARRLLGARSATLDGFCGVRWEAVRAGLQAALARCGARVAWVPVDAALRPAAERDALSAPYLGGADPLFGTRFGGQLEDFFSAEALAALRPDDAADLSLVYGCGAALANWAGPLVYLDLPKNEAQFRARAGVPINLGAHEPDARAAYKRAYFLDWPALSAHKAALLPRLDVFVDAQREGHPTLTSGAQLRAGLTRLSAAPFRARPWFEPGPWGGQWIKARVPELPQQVPNYAWSFELITPENGLLFASDDLVLECSFDLLMAQAGEAVLGEAYARFGPAFPIRFDWLDTVGGGHLSLQVHPRPDYMRRHFGEAFTQDETYYILDAEPGASVYLGFVEGVDPAAFRRDLEESGRSGTAVDVEHYVQKHAAAKHDLFLIPSGTVHCSGAGSLVLEISATPYIFTFKLYDWLRLDLEGRPRPLNIERAFDNLNFSRAGAQVPRDLIARPRVCDEGEGWRVVDLPTHPEHFYGVRRLEFTAEIAVDPRGSCQVLAVVEGGPVRLETGAGGARFQYAETFVVPAAAGPYHLVHEGAGEAKVIQAFVKPGRGP